MMADELLEQLSVEPLRMAGKLFNVQPGLDVEVIAEVASLEIQIDEAYPTILCRFGAPNLNSRLNRNGRIPYTASARNKGNNQRLIVRGRSLHRTCAAAPRYHIKNFLRCSPRRNPV